MQKRSVTVIGLGIACIATAASAQTQPHTLQEALAAAYSSNPTLLAARAALRAVDESVPQALAGWRPTVSVTGQYGAQDGAFKSATAAFAQDNKSQYSTSATITQPLYRGGRTESLTHSAENRVLSQRGRLIATEQLVFTNVITDYVNVIQTAQLLQLDINNEQVLNRQLQATNDRFRVGEITRTDVAQAEAALAGARATRQTAEGNVQTARAAFQRDVGFLPSNLTVPQPLALPIKTAAEASRIAAANNPSLIYTMFDAAASKDAVDTAFSALLPTVSAIGQAFTTHNTSLTSTTTKGVSAVVSLTVPIYQGGAEYSAVRQAKQTEQQSRKTVDDTRRQVIQAALSSWETLVAARSTIESTRAAIRANEIALEGTQREAIVGSRTTLDVLNAEQALLQSRVTLVQNLASLVTSSYAVAAALGRLTARDLNLNVPLYDDTAYYKAVHDRLFGTGDYELSQPGGDIVSGPTPPAGEGAADPSMEDILASIRRILNEDEPPPGPGVQAADEPPHAHTPPDHPPADGQDEGDDGILVLDEAMLVSEPEPPPSLSVVQREMGPDPAFPSIEMPPEPEAPPPSPPSPPPPLPLPSAVSSNGIMADASAAAAAASVGSLLRTLSHERTTQVHRGGPTIEDLVREEVRPLLKDWLDQHLPPLVERLVRQEIERVAGRAGL